MNWIQAAKTGIQQSQYGAVATAVVLNVVLGGALLASAAITRKNLMNGAIVAGVISIILIYFGGRPGQIGGIVGILGAILAAAKPNSEEHTSDLQSLTNLVCRRLLNKTNPLFSIFILLQAPL